MPNPTTPPAGLTVGVLRRTPDPQFAWTDTTLGGVSSTNDNLTVVGTIRGTGTKAVTPLPENSQVRQASHDAPAMAFHFLTNMGATTTRLVPVAWDPETGTYRQTTTMCMAGGNYAEVTDSRLGHTLTEGLGHRFYGAVAIHDRLE
ncbi:hypothetical protein GS504_01315 [Rhodococcus hoagii]|nr:hypothetical protein [Prescottella equi]NKS71688.1 hypothetical protein [Prescottella equi]